MKKVNLRDLYPDVYKNDYFVEVTEDVLETIRAAERAEAAYDRRMYRYKAHYSLDCDNGIENAILMKPQTPNEEDRYYSVYTFNQGLQKRLKNFAERYPECCYLSNSTKEGSETYIIQKGRLSLNLRPPYAKERIQKALETIQIAKRSRMVQKVGFKRKKPRDHEEK